MELTEVIILSFLFCTVFRGVDATYINVLDHGAVGDGSLDDSKAFLAAWEKGCNGSGSSKILIPEGHDYALDPVTFQGPCKSKMHFEIRGSIAAPERMWDHKKKMYWLSFKNLPKGLIIDGGGKVNGNGQVWWDCRARKECIRSPYSLTLDDIQGLEINNLRFEDSPQMHIAVTRCRGVTISELTIIAPGNSPNTDGIHLKNSQQVQISDCDIGTGDDCISIGHGVSDLQIRGINCGPGHGISIGSLGNGGAEGSVSSVHVSDCKFHDTTNGVRIKTWVGGNGLVDDITFQNIKFTSVKNPIILDQNYHAVHKLSRASGAAVKIQNVKFRELSGSAKGNYGIVFNCSAQIPCTGIEMEKVNILETDGRQAQSFCRNAEIKKKESITPKLLC